MHFHQMERERAIPVRLMTAPVAVGSDSDLIQRHSAVITLRFIYTLFTSWRPALNGSVFEIRATRHGSNHS